MTTPIDPPLMTGFVGPIALTDALRAEYTTLYRALTMKPQLAADAVSRAKSVAGAHLRYASVSKRLGGIPWWWIGLVHSMEASSSFATHLHNGDPLAHRTVNVPVGRPKNGNPPFSWEESAEDALRLKGLDQWDDWSVAGSLYQLERYNGFGYRRRGIHSPYLWAGSAAYERGRFVADHVFDPSAESKQAGAAVILRHLADRGEVVIANSDQ